MNRSVFVYVTYIRAAPERVWAALTEQNFITRYWFGVACESEWRAGSPWRMVYPDGRVTDDGEILEADPPKKLVIKWTHRLRPELTAEGPGRCTMVLEPAGDATKLTILHEIDKPQSLLIAAVSDGWPKILSNLKSLLETGEVALTLKP
jgi:uncharacterized protein YndB with AHSA1/START domain